MNSAGKARILIVEDDPAQIRAYRKILSAYDLDPVANGTEALSAMARRLPDLIILDHVLAGGERGGDFLPLLKVTAAHVPIVVVSGTLDVKGQLGLLQGPLSAHYTIEKPVPIDLLESTVERALTDCGFGEAVALLKSIERSDKFDHDDPDRRFIERLARQYDLLRRIRPAHGKVNISELARLYRVDRRTIRRDLHDLIRRNQLPQAILPDSEM